MTGPFYLAGKEWLLPAAVVLLIAVFYHCNCKSRRSS